MRTEYDKILFQKQAISEKGCGVGIEKACFALTRAAEGYVCGLVDAPKVAGMAGMGLGWRVNEDESDGKAWCPLGILGNSKSYPDRSNNDERK